jgi:hypothetical protein
MAELVYQEPIGTILRFPDGHKVQLVGGQRVQVPAGTIAESGAAGQEPRVLPAAGVVVAPGPAGKTAPVGGQAPPPPNVLRPGHPSLPATPGRPWNETPEGARLGHAYTYLHQTFAATIPHLRQSLRNRANRPLGG